MRTNLLATATTRASRCVLASNWLTQLPIAWLSRVRLVTLGRPPWINNLRRYAFPRLLISSSHALPPVKCCPGTSPGHIAKSAPFSIAATRAVATRALHRKHPAVAGTRRILAGNAFDLSAHCFDPFFEHLPILPQPIDKWPHTRRQPLPGISEQLGTGFRK